MFKKLQKHNIKYFLISTKLYIFLEKNNTKVEQKVEDKNNDGNIDSKQRFFL